MKREPFVDDLLKLPWPWRTERLVVKVGPSLVLGSGSPLRLNGKRLLGFEPVDIESLGGKCTSFDAVIPGASGESWLRIEDSSFEARLNDVEDLEFKPQLRQFLARHRDGSRLKLRFRRIPHGDFKSWFGEFVRQSPQQKSRRSPSDVVDSCYDHLDSMGLVDSDGGVPVMSFEGSFRCPEVEVRVEGDRFFFESFVPGNECAFEWHTHIVDDQRRMILSREKGPEFFSLG